MVGYKGCYWGGEEEITKEVISEVTGEVIEILWKGMMKWCKGFKGSDREARGVVIKKMMGEIRLKLESTQNVITRLKFD